VKIACRSTESVVAGHSMRLRSRTAAQNNKTC
jgi:hypothetical protein